MRKKFVQTLAARQLELHTAADEAINYTEQPPNAATNYQQNGQQDQQQQQQQDQLPDGEEIIEILDDDQEVELMMERHRKYHPRKYVNLQHPPSKIYYDKIDRIVSPGAGERDDEDQEMEDEDERNKLVIEEGGAGAGVVSKEINNNTIVAPIGNGGDGGGTTNGGTSHQLLDGHGVNSTTPSRWDENDLFREYHYRRLCGSSDGAPVFPPPQGMAPSGPPVAAAGRPSREQQPQRRQKKSRLRSSETASAPMRSFASPTPSHHSSFVDRSPQAAHERFMPYEKSPTAATSAATTTPSSCSPYKRRKMPERRMSTFHPAPPPLTNSAGVGGQGNAFLPPSARSEKRKPVRRNSAFSPPREREERYHNHHHHNHAKDANNSRAVVEPQQVLVPRPPVSATPGGAIVTPHTPSTYYPPQQQHLSSPLSVYQRSQQSSGSGGGANVSYMALEEWYRSGVPPPHMLTPADLQSMYYYHYYFNKMAAAASNVYHHPYPDHNHLHHHHHVPPAIMGPPGVLPAIPPRVSLYPPPQYGFAAGGGAAENVERSTTTALYGAQQPFDYTLYHHSVLSRTGYPLASSSCTGHLQQASATVNITTIATATGRSADHHPTVHAPEVIRPTVINRIRPLPVAVPRTVPVNLIHQRMPDETGAGGGGGGSYQPLTTVSSRTEPPQQLPSTIPKIPATTMSTATPMTPTSSSSSVVQKETPASRREEAHERAARIDRPYHHYGRSEESKSPETVASMGKPAITQTEKDERGSSSPRAGELTTTTTTTGGEAPQPRSRGRPPGAKNKNAAARTSSVPRVRASATLNEAGTAPPTDEVAALSIETTVIAQPTDSGPSPGAGGSANQSPSSPSSTTIMNARVKCMQRELQQFLERRRADVITTMRLYSVGRIDYTALLEEMKRHAVSYRDFLQVAYALIRKIGLQGFAREPPKNFDYRWKTPPQEFADYFAQSAHCSKAFVAENFDLMALIVDNLLQQYIEPLEYFLLTYVLGLRAK